MADHTRSMSTLVKMSTRQLKWLSENTKTPWQRISKRNRPNIWPVINLRQPQPVKIYNHLNMDVEMDMHEVSL